jgi:hypothetical protein
MDEGAGLDLNPGYVEIARQRLLNSSDGQAGRIALAGDAAYADRIDEFFRALAAAATTRPAAW